MKSTVCTYAIQKLENRTRWQAARHSRAADYCTQGTNFFLLIHISYVKLVANQVAAVELLYFLRV